MAKANKRTAQETVGHSAKDVADQETGELTVQQRNALAVAAEDFTADAGAGMEGAVQESFAIPFLIMLQKGSPQVDEASGVALPGAKQGMLFETVTGRLFDLKERPVEFIPCAYKRTFIRWGAKDAGGGFKGELTEAEVINMRQRGELKEVDNKLYVPLEGGVIDPKKCDVVNDTRNHYVLLLDRRPEGIVWTQCMISLASTQIKKSKTLMSALAGVKVPGPNGAMFTPATWANVVQVTSVPEKNDKGAWMGWKFELAGRVDRRDLYDAGKQFNQSVKKGIVETRYEDLDANTAAAGAEPSSNGGGQAENSF